MRLLVATTSAHKLEELGRMVEDLVAQGHLSLRNLADIPEDERFEVVEDAPDFAGNAEKKARAWSEKTGTWVLADDSGLCVDHLDGAPGVLSARFSGVDGDGRDDANNDRLLDALKDVSDEARGAAFVCSLALVAPDGRVWHVEGRCEGRIAYEPKGSGGFGYDPLFISHEPGQDRTTTHGQLAPGEKDAISHRGKALRALRPLLEDLVRGEG